jgi:hypothetical protein
MGIVFFDIYLFPARQAIIAPKYFYPAVLPVINPVLMDRVNYEKL